MSPERNPEAGNLGAQDDDAGSEIDVSMIPPSADLTTIITLADAERLTERIQLRLAMIADNIESVVSLIEQAKAGNIHAVLGYPSWTAYVAEKFGGTLARIGKAERLPIVEMLSGQGMSTRAIATVVGVSKSQVAEDIAGVQNWTPEVLSNGDLSRENAVAKVTAIKKIAGRDGKSYTRLLAVGSSRRRPLPDSYRDAAMKMFKSVESLSRWHQNDRFASNRETLKTRYGSELARAANELLAVLDDLGVDRHKYGGIR